MRLIASALLIVLAGCEKPVPPVYEEPVPLSISSGANALGPRLTTGTDGTILLSWMERREAGALLRVASFQDGAWSNAVDVVEDPDMFVNWADFPSVTALANGHWIAHWLSYSADLTYSYDVLIAQSGDRGVSWSEPMSPHSDGTPTEHGFVSVWPADAAAGLIWLDGRKTGTTVSDDPGATGMTLRAAIVARDGALSGEQEIDGLICDCCDTDVAVTAIGPIAVYRDRTADEIRDISISRFVDGAWQPGETFSEDGWVIAACPVNGPAIDAGGDLVAVAWFTAASDSPRVYVRLSNNGGRTFGEKILVASAKVTGYVDVAHIGDSSFAVSWVQGGDDLADIRVRSVTRLGELGRIKTVGRSAERRSVPQMIHADGRLILAWTDRVGDVTHLASATVEIAYAH